MSRSVDKMKEVAQQLERDYKVKTKVIEFNLAISSAKEVENLYTTLDTITEDVCLLVNNAGKAHANPIHEHSVDICFNMINLNINGSVFIARYFIKKFLDRFEQKKTRSAIVNLSSIAAIHPTGGTSIYGSTKAFDRIFSLNMRKEYSDKIDVLTVLPLSTKS